MNFKDFKLAFELHQKQLALGAGLEAMAADLNAIGPVRLWGIALEDDDAGTIAAIVMRNSAKQHAEIHVQLLELGVEPGGDA